MTFNLSAFADEYSKDFDEQIEILRTLGIPYIELRFIDGVNVADLDEKKAAEINHKLRANKIFVSAIGSPLGKVDIESDLGPHWEKAERVFALAKLMGAEYVRVFSFYHRNEPYSYGLQKKVLAAMEKLLLLAEPYGVTLCHENEAGIFGESPAYCKVILYAFGGKLRAVFDMGNFVLDGYDPLAAYEMLGSYIEYFHIKDALYAGVVVPAGKGDAKIEEILQRAAADGKNRIITLEPHLQTFAGLNRLAGKAFENPYKYANEKEAFIDAFVKLNKIIEKVEHGYEKVQER